MATNINRTRPVRSALMFVALAVGISSINSVPASAAVQSLIFPVIGPSSYSDDFTGSRFNGQHKATDIFGNKRQKIVSASNGTVRYVENWGTAGYSVRILGTDGVVYNYYHLNNDTAGTDDGASGEMGAYAPDIEPGNAVIKGQHLGYLGDSGNAENTPPHLHFEIYSIRSGGSVGNPYDGGKAVNPYTHLNNAKRIKSPISHPALTNEILPFGNGSFRGGARVASGDFDGDGTDEIVVAAGPGGTSVRVFEMDGTQIARFTPYTNGFTGGADVAAGDTDGDGTDEIVVAAGPGGTSIRIFEANGTQVKMFTPFTSNIKSGASIAVADVMADDAVEIIAAPKKNGSPTIVTLSADGVRQYAYTPYGGSYRGGLRIEAGELDPAHLKSEIISVPESNGASYVKISRANGRILQDSVYVAERWWKGYHDTVVVEQEALVSLNVNRRTSLRYVE